ncbi:hypothetical protein UB51_11130 [Paenibacillus sp. IHBB 10380]|nr:hypothetical protein UB51_11130 [Paenibacillus sp. IHBB 10380]
MVPVCPGPPMPGGFSNGAQVSIQTSLLLSPFSVPSSHPKYRLDKPYWHSMVHYLSLCCSNYVFVIHKKFHNNPLLLMTVITTYAIAGLLYNLLFTPLLWNLDAAMIVLPFFGLGHLFKQYQHKLTAYLNYKFLALFFNLNLLTGMLNAKIDIFSGAYGN